VAVLLCLLLFVLFRAGLVAVKVSRMQSDIVAGVSHDLKTPLAGILASAQLIASGRAHQPQDVQEFAGYIMAEAKRLTAVVEKVLTMARLESRQLVMRPTAVSISRLVDQAIESVRCAFPGALILKGALPDDEIQADFQALTTVLVNLIDNAVRYSGEQPRVVVSARWTSASDRRVLHLSVQDCGVGIPPEEQPLIFQKFYRVRRGLVNDTDGTGLGLAIASEIVRAHHGLIQVESRVGGGSTFTVVLPHEQSHFSG
jgi:two-component system phosphate regulon sensor histidine kinase PhoR